MKIKKTPKKTMCSFGFLRKTTVLRSSPTSREKKNQEQPEQNQENTKKKKTKYYQTKTKKSLSNTMKKHERLTIMIIKHMFLGFS